MNLIFTVFSTVFFGVLAALAHPQSGCVCGPFGCFSENQDFHSPLASSTSNGTDLTCVYEDGEICVYSEANGQLQGQFKRGCFVDATGSSCGCPGNTCGCPS